MGRPSNRETLLDTAEELFAKHGIRGVSLRAIEAAAGLSVGSLHYHFDNLQVLVEALVGRHLPKSMARRVELLEALERKPEVKVRDIVSALVDPMTEMLAEQGDAGVRHVKLMHRLLIDDDFGFVTLSDRWPEVTERIPVLLRKALPHIPEELLRLRFDLAWESILSGLSNCQNVPNQNLNDYATAVIDYVTGALEAPDTTR